jgi:two-component system sensor histidine kinase KdpD
LLENATKYTPPRSRIAISARKADEFVEIEGPGIPPGEEERIFEKFHRASRATAGMGLGLTICRGIVVAPEVADEA